MAVSARELEERVAALGFTPEFTDDLGGRYRGERMDRFALDNIVYAIAEATDRPPIGAGVVVDDSLVRGSPPPPN